MQIRTPYSKYKKPKISFKKSKQITKQSFKQQCDINNIVDRFTRTGELPDRGSEQYGEQPPDDSFQRQQFALAEVNSMFERLNPDQREKFQTPQDVIDAIRDPSSWNDLIPENENQTHPPADYEAEPNGGAPAEPQKSEERAP